MIPSNREELVDELQASRRALIEAVEGIDQQQAAATPEKGWTIQGCVEHCALAERGMLAMIVKMSEPADDPERPNREADIMDLGLNRNRPLNAPQAAHPGRYETMELALQRFNEARDRTIEYVQKVDGDMRNRMVQHPVGRITTRECLLLMIQHPRRHAEQIRALRATL